MGLANKTSDIDVRAVYAAPPKTFWTLHKVRETFELKFPEQKIEVVAFELGKFCSLVLKCNPNILEILYSPCVFQTSWKIRVIREHFPERVKEVIVGGSA